MVTTTFLTSLFSCRIFASGMLAVFADGLSLAIVGIAAHGDMPIRKWSAMIMSTHGWRVAQVWIPIYMDLIIVFLRMSYDDHSRADLTFCLPVTSG